MRPFRVQLSTCESRVASACIIISPEGRKDRIGILEGQTIVEGFWDDQQAAQCIMSEITACKEDVALINRWAEIIADARAALELAADEPEVWHANHMVSFASTHWPALPDIKQVQEGVELRVWSYSVAPHCQVTRASGRPQQWSTATSDRVAAPRIGLPCRLEGSVVHSVTRHPI
jgi:hypothetical protein